MKHIYLFILFLAVYQNSNCQIIYDTIYYEDKTYEYETASKAPSKENIKFIIIENKNKNTKEVKRFSGSGQLESISFFTNGRQNEIFKTYIFRFM